MTTIKFIGVENVISKINKIREALEGADMLNTLTKSAEHLRDKAIDNLISTSKGYVGKSIQGGRISDEASWLIEPLKSNSINLKCISEHAAIVEFGSPGTILISHHYGYRGWPIGRQQGVEPPIIRSRITLQGPKSYLRGAISSEPKMILDIFKRDIKKIIAGIL